MKWIDSLHIFFKMSSNSYLNVTGNVSSSLAEDYTDVVVRAVVLFTMPSLFCLFLWSGTESIPCFYFCVCHIFCRPCSVYLWWMCHVRTFDKGILPNRSTAVGTVGCVSVLVVVRSWLIVMQAGGMHQEVQGGIIKDFPKLMLRFLLKNKVYSENLTLVKVTLKISF